VSEAERPLLAPEVRDFEPPEALFAGVDGLDGVRSVLNAAVARLSPDGWLVMEFGLGQDDSVTALVNDVSGLDLVKIRHDLQDIPRTVVCRKGRGVDV
jgi:release factor glutamine methyltransferase